MIYEGITWLSRRRWRRKRQERRNRREGVKEGWEEEEVK